MAGTSCMVRPVAAEDRNMLQKIKMDNMERGRRVAGAVSQPAPLNLRRSNFNFDQQQ